MAKALDPNIIQEAKFSPQYNRTSSGHTITRTFNIYIFDAVAAQAYGPDYDEEYEGADGTTDPAVVTDIECTSESTNPAEPLCRGTWTYTHDTSGGGGGNERQRDSWEIDLVGGSEHITHVKKSGDQRVYPGGNIDPSTAIGVNGDKIEGVDIGAQSATIKIHKWFRPEDITFVQVALWHLFENTTNVAAYTCAKIRAQRGELLFRGASISHTLGEKVKVDFEFGYEKNRLGDNGIQVETLAGDIVVPKYGWEYLWNKPGRKMEQVGSAGATTKSGIESVHVAKVYEASNFKLLNADIEIPT